VVFNGAGNYPVVAMFTPTDTSRGTVSVSGSVTVSTEDATAAYTGPQFVSTGSATATSVLVPLTAQVEQAGDGYPGDLTRARVDFLLYRSTDVTMSNAIVVPNIVVSSSGVATATSPLLSLDNYTVVVRFSPGNRYFDGPNSDAQVLTVYAPTTGKWATGGGWVHDPSSGVSLSNDHGNFGFSVRYKSGTTTPQGQSVFVWRGIDGYDYIVKSNSWNGGGAAFGTKTAGFSGKAVVIVYDPVTGTSVSGLGGGNFSYRVDVTDNGTGGSTDAYAISVYTPKGKLYHQAGTSSVRLTLGGGNVTVHGT